MQGVALCGLSEGHGQEGISVNWTEAEYQSHLAKLKGGDDSCAANAGQRAASGVVGSGRAVSDSVAPVNAWAGANKKARMNKLEAEYAQVLDVQLRVGDIKWWAFEPFKLRLAQATSYTPDFGILTNDGRLEFAETKGFWREDARVKIKVAAEIFPFKFVALTKCKVKDGGGWKIEEFVGFCR